MIEAHQFQRDKSVAIRHYPLVGATKICRCGAASWHPIHDPMNWSKRYRGKKDEDSRSG